MEREDYLLLPLVAIGLVKALGEVVIRPALEDFVTWVQDGVQVEPAKRVGASIQHYRTPE